MRRSVLFLTPLIPLAVAACEDGPNQTFQPATGTLFNNGDTPAAVTDAGNPLNQTYGGSTKTQLCAGDELQKQWSAMTAQPLAPIRYVAGVDLNDGPNFPLLTIEKAEQGPIFAIQTACVTEPTPKDLTKFDGFYGAVPGVAALATDPCLNSASGKPNTQTQCAALANSQLTANPPSKTFCGWNVVPNTSGNLSSNPPVPTRLCQPTNLGPGGNGGDVGGSILEQWGNNGEFQMEWAIPTHKAHYLALNPGYVGHMQWNYLDPATKTVNQFDWKMGVPIRYTVGTSPTTDYNIHWNGPPATVAPAPPGYQQEADTLYRGIASTFAPDIYDDAPTGITCSTTGTCFALPNGGDGTGRALFGMRPVSFYMWFNPPSLPDPSGYTVNSAYLFNIKYAPYSGAHAYFKMYDPDAAAAQPFADGLVGNKSPPSHCHFGMNDTFENLVKNCIDVFAIPAGCNAGDPCDPNIAAEHKVLGNLAHDDQDYTFSVVGINQNFRSVKLDVCTPALCGGKQPTPAGTCPAGAPGATNCGTDTQDVVHDTDSPLTDQPNTLANDFQADVRSFGGILNDFYPDKKTTNLIRKDYHGSGAVWREYARLVQTDMAAQYAAAHAMTPKAWHDQSCFFPVVCSNGGPISTCGENVQTPTAPPIACDPAAAFPDALCNEATTPPTPCTATGTECAALPGTTCDLTAGDPNINTCINTHFCDAVATDPAFKTCVKSHGSPTLGANMEMPPYTTCTSDAVCKAVHPAGSCYLPPPPPAPQPPPNGVTPGTCQIPFDVNTWRPAPGCTGFESMITSAEKIGNSTVFGTQTVLGSIGDFGASTANDDIWDLGKNNPYGGGFKPGQPNIMFCNDPGMNQFCGQNGDIQGLTTDLLGASTQRLLQYLGNGDTLNLPLEGRDRRYFFKQWTIAYAKYMSSPTVLDTGLRSAGVAWYGGNGKQVDPIQIATKNVDTDNFIFDSFGGGASRSEFIDFETADPDNDPVSIEQRILLIGSNLQGTNFFRKLDREERAIFNMLQTDPTQASWGYIKDSTGAFAYDTWVTDKQPPQAAPPAPFAPCTQAQCNALGVPHAVCDVNPRLSDANSGYCVLQFPRHNANPFLTNMTGSAVLSGTWANPQDANGTTIVPAPAGWVDPCNPIAAAAGIKCNANTDCPGLMACDTTAHACGAAITAYYCATHGPSDAAASANCPATAPLDPATGNILRRANGKPLLEGYCGVFQPGPFALTSNAVTPTPASGTFPTPYAKNINTSGVAPGVQVLKTFPSLGEALVSLPTFPNPYNADPATNKKPVAVMVPWLPLQEGIGYPVAANGSTDVFVKTAQFDFVGQVITPVVDFLPVPLSCMVAGDCSGGLVCVGAVAKTPTSAAIPGQCLSPGGAPISNPVPPYGISIQAIETADFLGEVFLCIDGVSAANNAALGIPSPGDILSAHMYSSAETIIDWLNTHPGAQTACGIIVRYSVYNNYPDYITTLTGGVRLNFETGGGFGRVVDAISFVPGSGSVAVP